MDSPSQLLAPTRLPLSIALLNSIPQWGGGEKWCVSAGAALQRRGHHVLIACGTTSELRNRAIEAGLPVWSHATWGRFGWAPGAAKSLGKKLVANKVGAVIANVGRDLRLGAKAARLSGAHLLQRRGLLRAIKATRGNRKLYAHVSRVIVNCEAIGERMRSGPGGKVVPAERFFVLPNGTAIPAPIEANERSAARAALGLGGEAPVALVVGRLAAMKGHGDLLAAWQDVLARLPESKLLIAGAGELDEELHADVTRRGVDHGVSFLGFRRDLRRLFAAADVVVCASTRDEGLNNAVLEAMAHACACVVTDCGGLPELVVDCETGRVVPVGDPERMGRALLAVLTDTAARQRFAAAARSRAEEHFSEPRVIDRLEAMLRSLSVEPLKW